MPRAPGGAALALAARAVGREGVQVLGEGRRDVVDPGAHEAKAGDLVMLSDVRVRDCFNDVHPISPAPGTGLRSRFSFRSSSSAGRGCWRPRRLVTCRQRRRASVMRPATTTAMTATATSATVRRPRPGPAPDTVGKRPGPRRPKPQDS